MNSYDTHFSQYTKNSKNVCLCTTISIVLIFIFIISPLNDFTMTSSISKVVIVIILAYALYKNLEITHQFSQNSNMQLLNGEWDNIKTNVVCSYIFSIFIILLIISVSKTLLKSIS